MKDHLPVPYRDQFAIIPRDPIITPIATAIASAAIAAGVPVWTAVSLVPTIVGIGSQVLVSVGLALVSSLVNTLFAPSAPKPRIESVKRELGEESSLPLKRFVYGRIFAPGTPAPYRVQGNILYGCHILNSRVSAGGTIEIQIDGRDVTLSNAANLTDFTATGGDVATASNTPFSGYTRFWLGLGDQVGPPDEIVSEASSIFQSTDGWTGLTVLWTAFDIGPASSQLQRWPNPRPVVQVRMDYSKVWDPRDAAQSLDDPTTWTFSKNQALCALDAHTQNPIQPYAEGDMHMSSWIDAANAADEDVALAAGGTENRYEVNGVVAFNAAELHRVVSALFEAGASQAIVIGGQTGILPGVYQEPDVTVTDVIGDSLSFDTLQPVRDIANTILTSYVSPDRNEESADLPPYSVAGAVAEDGGVPSAQRLDLTVVTSPTQAARIQKIAAYEARAQRTITSELPPEMFDLTAGAGATVAFPAPYDVLNGVHQVRTITPLAMPSAEGGNGVALRLPAVLREYSADWFAWSTSEEPDIPAAEPLSTTIADLVAPASVTVTSVSVSSGGATVVGGRMEWAPVATEISSYQTEYRESGGDWISGPIVDEAVRDSGGDVFAVINPLAVGTTYEFRVRSVAAGRVSDWTEQTGVTITAPGTTLSAPDNGSATAAGTSQIDVSYTLPNETDARGINFYSGSTSDTGTMTQLGSTVFAGANTQVDVSETGLSAATTRYYSARSVDQFDQESAFASVVSATTDP